MLLGVPFYLSNDAGALGYLRHGWVLGSQLAATPHRRERGF
jgi:hypothetical protein